MINFFRKTRKKLADDNKPLKYMRYAIGEILLVMVGILLAVQVNDWNESRKTNKQELELIESLYKEFTFNRDELDRSIKKAKGIQNRCVILLENTGNHEMKLSRFESDSLIHRGFLDIVTYDASNSILDDIINSGKIHVLKNEKLKKYLSNWEAALNDVKEDETWGVNARNNILLPFIYSNSNYINISQRNIYNKNITSGFNTDYKDIYKLLEFENLVISQVIWNGKNERGYKRLKKMVEEIIFLCEKDIKLKNK